MPITYLTPDFEQYILASKRYSRIIGIDEVGRGCWAGPTTVGAYIFDATSPTLENIQDSKLLSEEERKNSHKQLVTHSPIIQFGSIDEINQKGIGKTIESLIHKIILENRDGNTLFLIDGQHAANFGNDTLKVKKGDSTYYSIAAASIAAKVERDALMKTLHFDYPLYGFDTHKGYATKFHRDMIETYGICKLHRTSFAPLKKYV